MGLEIQPQPILGGALPGRLDNAGQFTLVGPLAQLIAAEAEIAIDAPGLACGPAAVAHTVGSAAAGQILGLLQDPYANYVVQRALQVH